MATSPSNVMSRPARRQIAKEKVLGPQASVAARGGQPGQTYNIYYDRWSGGGGGRGDRSSAGKDKAPHRCNPATDSGRTKGTYNPNAYFCAFFAKGCCPNGEDCGWLHRIPTRQDHVDSGMDVFGRERFDEHRDDRGGVGSIRSDSKTLYVGRIHQYPDMEAIVEKHFKAWGDLERIKILQDKGIAFVTYQSRLNAEFAKEAMANQSLDHGEIVNIRWATEDPNPGIQARNKRKAVEMARQAIESRLPEDFKQAEHLPGSEEATEQGPDKRQKQTAVAISDSRNGVSDPTPTLYLGVDGQYYYDYGGYGYNHETQQYDPARLGHYQGTAIDSSSEPSLQDRVKASLLSSSASTTALVATPSISTVKDTSAAKSKPTTSALGALAAYDSDSDSENDG
ncbi:Pre-mRNA-splicing factor [Haplosporangium sp. Z 767]|nr:Pre-mRNA-splicing factor [Haplosporangium sp. Z 11]KAF9184944.1 Pre-mRNA-splicing factor [Haplosporangium sp. Z 767]